MTTSIDQLYRDIKDLNLHPRVTKALKDANVQIVKDFLSMSKEDFQNIPGFGRVSQQKVSSFLKNEELFVGMARKKEAVHDARHQKWRLTAHDIAPSGIEKRMRRIRRR